LQIYCIFAHSKNNPKNKVFNKDMTIYPNAKINIGLHIVNKRPDGYHNIETVFYPIGLCDCLDVTPSGACNDYSFSTSGISLGGNPEDNLILRAYRLLQAEYGIPPVDISLVKEIPFGAGLGGGSSDAAFMLKALNEIFNLKITTGKLEKIAAKLGADCPFFIKNKPVFASGKGNEFTSLSVSLENYYLALVKPDVHISTPEAYSMITPRQPETPLSELIRQPVNLWKHSIKNDFEKPVFARYPEIAQIKQSLYNLGAVYASMSGSGSSVFGLFENKPEPGATFDGYFTVGGYLV
jgi:4-diphosphocytidyl-2-C-methyl-D-erythritol kinase